MPKSLLARSERYQRFALYGVSTLLSVAILLATWLFGVAAFQHFQEQQISRFVQYREQVKSETDQLSARLMQFVDLYEGIWALHDQDSIPLPVIGDALRKGDGIMVSDSSLTATPFSIISNLGVTATSDADMAELARQLRIVRDLSAAPAIDTRKLGINLSGYLYAHDYRFIAIAPPLVAAHSRFADASSIAATVQQQTSGIESILAPYSVDQLRSSRPFWTSQSDFGGPDTISRIILPMLRDNKRIATIVVTVPEDQFFRVFLNNERIPGFFLLDNASHAALGYDPRYIVDRRLFEAVNDDINSLSNASAHLQTFRKAGTFFISQKIEGPGWSAVLAYDWRDILRALESTYSAGALLCLAALAALWGSVIYFEMRIARPLRLGATRLMEVKQFNRTIIDTLPVGIAVFDPTAQRVLLENAVAKGMLRLDEDSEKIAFYTRMSERDSNFSQASLTLDQHRSSHLGVVCSKTRWSGRDVLLIGLVDMNERIATEHKLKAAVAEAERANRAKSMFLGLMSHEIKTPLHGAIGHLELLSQSDLSPETQARVALVNRSVDALLTLVNDLLDITKIEVDAFKLHLKPVLLSKLIDRSAQNFSAAICAKGLGFWCASEPALDCPVMADEQRLMQILQNLLNNACKFTDRGSIALHGVCLDRSEHEIKVRLTVEDTGIGIPVEQQARIFKPLTQANDTISQQYGGPGLYLCRDLTSLMGGHISIESTPGHGSCFHVDLSFPLVAVGKADHAGNTEQSLLASRSVELICPVPAWEKLLIARVNAWGGCLYHQASETQRGPDIRLYADTHVRDGDNVGLDSDPHNEVTASLYLSPAGPLLPVQMAESSSSLALHSTSLSSSALINALSWCVKGVNSVAASSPEKNINAPVNNDLDVIVAEDNPISLNLITQQLRELGIHKVRTATNGNEAIALWRQAPADLLISDWQMPECDGLGVLHAIREIDPNATIVATTALTQGDLTTDEHDFNEILYKPIRLQDLQNMLIQVCGHLSGAPISLLERQLTESTADSTDERIDQQLLTMFIQSWAQERNALEDLFAQGDPQRLKRRLHRLQGGLLAIGLNQLAALNLRLQENIGATPWRQTEVQYRHLLQQLDALSEQ